LLYNIQQNFQNLIMINIPFIFFIKIFKAFRLV
jgi:hypothetical protein